MISNGTKVLRTITLQNIRFEIVESWSLKYFRNGKACMHVEKLYHVEALHPISKAPWNECPHNRFNFKTKKELNYYLIQLGLDAWKEAA